MVGQADFLFGRRRGAAEPEVFENVPEPSRADASWASVAAAPAPARLRPAAAAAATVAEVAPAPAPARLRPASAAAAAVAEAAPAPEPALAVEASAPADVPAVPGQAPAEAAAAASVAAVAVAVAGTSAASEEGAPCERSCVEELRALVLEALGALRAEAAEAEVLAAELRRRLQRDREDEEELFRKKGALMRRQAQVARRCALLTAQAAADQGAGRSPSSPSAGASAASAAAAPASGCTVAAAQAAAGSGAPAQTNGTVVIASSAQPPGWAREAVSAAPFVPATAACAAPGPWSATVGSAKNSSVEVDVSSLVFELSEDDFSETLPQLGRPKSAEDGGADARAEGKVGAPRSPTSLLSPWSDGRPPGRAARGEEAPAEPSAELPVPKVAMTARPPRW